MGWEWASGHRLLPDCHTHARKVGGDDQFEFRIDLQQVLYFFTGSAALSRTVCVPGFASMAFAAGRLYARCSSAVWDIVRPTVLDPTVFLQTHDQVVINRHRYTGRRPRDYHLEFWFRDGHAEIVPISKRLYGSVLCELGFRKSHRRRKKRW